jgi:L-lysine 2,3-aminomutase
MAYRDPERQRAAERKWYLENRQKVFDKKNRKKTRMRQFLREWKSRPCADCGVSYPYYVMDLDHVDGDKVMNVSALVLRGSMRLLMAELEKCEVVCANCHRTRTFSRLMRTRPPELEAPPTLFDWLEVHDP